MAKTVKKPAQEDWHPADIKAAIEKAGYTQISLGEAHGYSKSFIPNVLRQKSPNAERVVAETIGVQPWDIWPSRYDENHQPLVRRSPASHVRPKTWMKTGRKTSRKDTAPLETCNGNVAAG